MKILIGTTNPAKAKVFVKQFEGYPVEIVTLKDLGIQKHPDEDGKNPMENAVIKAQAVAKATGYCALADDSGLAVDALGGAPGVYSARYAGGHGDDAANNALLIENMKDVAQEDRTAQFVCAMALALPNGETHTV